MFEERANELKARYLGIVLITILVCVLPGLLEVPSTKASLGTIYINPDGSITPSNAPIKTIDNITYTFTSNIDSLIFVERDNIVVNGAGFTLQGAGNGTGIYLSSRNHVTIKNTSISMFDTGIYLYQSSSNTIINDTITDSVSYAIHLHSVGSSSNLNVIQNNTLSGGGSGIYFSSDGNYPGDLSYNDVSHNIIKNYGNGIFLNPIYQLQSQLEYNTFGYNKISNCTTAVRIAPSSGYCTVRHNLFHDNSLRDGQYGVYFDEWYGRGIEVYSNNFTSNTLTDFSSYGVCFANSETYGNDFGGNNTMNGNHFYHYAYRQNEIVSNLNLNENNDATNLGMITVVESNNVTLNNCSIAHDKDYGVFLWYNANCSILNSRISKNGNVTGESNIYAYGEAGSSVMNNALSDGFNGISLFSSSGIKITHNSISNMSEVGIYLYESSSNTIEDNNVTNSSGYAIRLHSKWGSSNLNVIQNNTLSGGGSGIYFSSDGNYPGDLSNNTISHNSIRGFGNGIFVNPTYQIQSQTEYNTFKNNSILSCATAIRIAPSGGFCTVSYNVFCNNSLRDGQYGIYLDEWYGRNIEVCYNNFTSNELTNFSSYGIFFANSETFGNDFGSNNTLNGNRFYHYAYQQNHTIIGLHLNSSNDATNLGLFTLVSCQNITLKNCSLSGDRDYGFFLWGSNNNTLVNSSITANTVGIYVFGSNYNCIYHDSFNNTNQAQVTPGSTNTWDNGYPSGGNYWSDYLTRYPNAAENDSSGIWNTSYLIDANNVDYYPLMNQPIIPEFPSFLILPLMIMATLLAVIIYRRKHSVKISACEV
jgi:parallel beta-helix repeat protein